MSQGEIVRVLRVLEYTGTRRFVERSLEVASVPLNGEKAVGEGWIKSALIGTFPEVVETANKLPAMPQGWAATVTSENDIWVVRLEFKGARRMEAPRIHFGSGPDLDIAYKNALRDAGLDA